MDVDTFVTRLYVMVDDFCKRLPPGRARPGEKPSLTRSEMVTLLLFAQWRQFGSERAFYRYARRHLRAAFPTLPARTQFNRQARQVLGTVLAFSHHLAEQMGAHQAPYQVLDTMGCAVRNAQRRGHSWLEGVVNIGRCNRLGWYEGFNVLTCVTPQGVITGFGLAAASTNERPFTEAFLAARASDHPRLPEVGPPLSGYYVADTGFEGARAHSAWAYHFGAHFITPPKSRQSRTPWPKARRRWHAALRQIVETVHDKLLNTFGLSRERPHDLQGFRSRLAAKVCLHNFCICLNRQLDRNPLAFADLLEW